MRPVLAILVLSAAALSLTGCAPDDHVLPPTATPDPPQVTLPPEPVNETVGINCVTLINDQAMYDWGSGNFALESGFSPEAGSTAAQIAADGGLACRWINLTSQETVDAAVSIPTDADLEAARQAAAATGTATPEFGDAYFSAADGVGHLDVFTGGYWLTLQSSWFTAPSDASPLVEAAMAALPPLG